MDENRLKNLEENIEKNTHGASLPPKPPKPRSSSDENPAPRVLNEELPEPSEPLSTEPKKRKKSHFWPIFAIIFGLLLILACGYYYLSVINPSLVPEQYHNLFFIDTSSSVKSEDSVNIDEAVKDLETAPSSSSVPDTAGTPEKSSPVDQKPRKTSSASESETNGE